MSPLVQRDKTETLIRQVSQETLAEMVGTTRSRVNFFMNKFRRKVRSVSPGING